MKTVSNSIIMKCGWFWFMHTMKKDVQKSFLLCWSCELDCQSYAWAGPARILSGSELPELCLSRAARITPGAELPELRLSDSIQLNVTVSQRPWSLPASS